MFKVGFFQFAPKFAKVKENAAKVCSSLEKADADVIVLPELPFTGYYFEDREELESVAEALESSASIEALTQLCRAGNFHVVSGFAEKAGDKIFNSSVLVGPSGVEHVYRKIHLFNTEKEYFDPGDTALAVHEVKGVKIGMMVCFDWAFPEVSRVLALKGADVICHPSNLVLTYCQETMRGRCIENSVFAVTANRYGVEKRPRGELAFTGQSQVTGPKGEVLFRAEADSEILHIVEIDPEQARDKSLTAANDLLGDRRPEFYGAITGGQ